MLILYTLTVWNVISLEKLMKRSSTINTLYFRRDDKFYNNIIIYCMHAAAVCRIILI